MKEERIILIVDDEPLNRIILKNIVELDYDVMEAENGKEALRIIKKKRESISAILLDLIMPVMDGHQMMMKMKEAGITDLPIIVTTISDDIETEKKVLAEGAWDFVTKPYNVTILQLRLKNAIERSKIASYEKLRYISEHDELTGLYNRNRMFQKTSEMIKQHPKKQFVFLRMDIDHFAMYNSSFGVEEGDRLLRYLATNIPKLIGNDDLMTYGRISADIFCICESYDGNEENLRAKVNAVQELLHSFRDNYRLGVSVGVCVVDDPKLNIEEYYIRSAIAAQNCKDQVDVHLSFYDKSYGEQMAVENAITNEMQSALNERQFVVYLQPKFCLPEETPCGAEALVRWMHPKKGLISPAAFIPVFEKNGFIAKLDYYVWEETCAMLRTWIDLGKKPFPISVNISRISLYNPNLPQIMTNLVNKYGISPALLQLEITESAYMTNPELMEQIIDSLHNEGFTILMDDFGSGYSSLNTLKRIHVDVLKIDMKFLPINDDIERGEIILSCIIKMAKWLGMTVVVEGVETRHQRDFVEGVGCDSIQGFYYSKPVSKNDYEEKFLEYVIQNDKHSQTDAPQHNMTILVLENSEVDSEILYNCLCGMYHVHVVENAEAALAYLSMYKNRVRLMLVDKHMSGMNGLDFIRHCAHDSELKAIPKIMITADANVQDQVEAFAEGAYDYITKPFVVEIIIARVKHVMDISYISSVFDTLDQAYKKAPQLDPATRLLNKRTFRTLASNILDTNKNDEEALMVIDIDNFKEVNERYGHIEGDKVIKCVADALTKAFRKSDVIGRLGGDEFVVMMTKLHSRETAKRKALEIIKDISISCTKVLNIETGVSVGITFSEKGDTIDTIFARADQALYQVKVTEKGRYAVYGESVPEIVNDNKPIVMICSENEFVHPALALAYGTDAAFDNVSSYEELMDAFSLYYGRIRIICLDMESKITRDTERFYMHILQCRKQSDIPIIGLYREGNMRQLCEAVDLGIFDIISIPPQNDIVQRKISRALLSYGMKDG